jgi:hypothetical protein
LGEVGLELGGEGGEDGVDDSECFARFFELGEGEGEEEAKRRKKKVRTDVRSVADR